LEVLELGEKLQKEKGLTDKQSSYETSLRLITLYVVDEAGKRFLDVEDVRGLPADVMASLSIHIAEFGQNTKKLVEEAKNKIKNLKK
jgi:hypothetical protein